MAIRHHQHPSEGKHKEKELEEGQGGDDSCRCKETAKMSPRELLRLMLNDLSFWKKGRDGGRGDGETRREIREDKD